MKTLEIKTKGKFTEKVHGNEHVSVWLFKTHVGQRILIQAFRTFDVRLDQECEIDCSLKLKITKRDIADTMNMKLYLETVEYTKTYQPGEKIPLEMTKDIEKFYWKTKDRTDITLEETNALRFIETQMQNDWQDYLLEGEEQ